MKAYVKLIFNHFIDYESVTSFERDVFNDSYDELLMQIQSFNANNQFNNWNDLISAVPKAAQNVPYKTAFAIGLYVKNLNGIIPGLVDQLGFPVSFKTYQLQIIESDFSQRNKHKIALHYTTDTFVLIDTIGDYLLLSTETEITDNTISTFMLKLQPNLSITSYSTNKS